MRIEALNELNQKTYNNTYVGQEFLTIKIRHQLAQHKTIMKNYVWGIL